ncbi:hypothetical protein VTI74DRAFT_2385 [Chaetomium olivicolor]
MCAAMESNNSKRSGVEPNLAGKGMDPKVRAKTRAMVIGTRRDGRVRVRDRFSQIHLKAMYVSSDESSDGVRNFMAGWMEGKGADAAAPGRDHPRGVEAHHQKGVWRVEARWREVEGGQISEPICHSLVPLFQGEKGDVPAGQMPLYLVPSMEKRVGMGPGTDAELLNNPEWPQKRVCCFSRFRRGTPHPSRLRSAFPNMCLVYTVVQELPR